MVSTIIVSPIRAIAEYDSKSTPSMISHGPIRESCGQSLNQYGCTKARSRRSRAAEKRPIRAKSFAIYSHPRLEAKKARFAGQITWKDVSTFFRYEVI